MIKLIATDMDGTLLNSRKELPPDFCAWVLNHPEIKVVIASGRQYYTLRAQFGAAAGRLIYIAENGALAFERGQVLYRNTVAREDALLCLEAVRGLPGVTPILCGVHSAYMRHGPEHIEAQGYMYYRRLAFVEELIPCLDTDEVTKIALYVEEGRRAETRALLEDVSDRIRPVPSGSEWIDLGNRNASKGAALRVIQEKYGVGRNESMGFGDYMNDFELLEQCGESYAMANACEEIRAMAAHTAASNDEDGVMRVLRNIK